MGPLPSGGSVSFGGLEGGFEFLDMSSRKEEGVSSDPSQLGAEPVNDFETPTVSIY